MSEGKEDRKPNLAGWAAVLTAIATLITAFGFPDFFPDLVKRFSPASSSESTPLSSSQIAPSIEESNPPITPSPSPFDRYVGAPPSSADEHVNVPSSSTTTLTPAKSEPLTTPLQRISEKNFLFVFNGCDRNGKNIECQLTIKNQGEDRRQLFLSGSYGNPSVIFANGTRYVANEVKLADVSRSHYVSLEMPSNININAIVSFPDVPIEISKLDAVEFWASYDGNFPLKFSDVFVSVN